MLTKRLRILRLTEVIGRKSGRYSLSMGQQSRVRLDANNGNGALQEIIVTIPDGSTLGEWRIGAGAVGLSGSFQVAPESSPPFGFAADFDS